MVGHVGIKGIQAGTNVGTSGAGGGASAIRIQGGALVAAAGGGGGGGAAGAAADLDATGGAGGNSVDGSQFFATNVGDTYGGKGGVTSTATGEGSSQHNIAGTFPPTKTEDLQDGGDGAGGNNNATATGGASANNTNPVGWGGSGGTGGVDTGAEGAGGAGGGGYFGGGGGSGATSLNQSGAGGGGGGSYVNATYVSTYASEVGSYETANIHAGTAIAQAAGSSATQFIAGVGEGGRGLGASAPEDGLPGAVYILKDGVVVASITAGGTETTYTIP